MENYPNEVRSEVVVSLDYTLTVDGELVDSSEETGPIQFIQGSGDVIPGLEREIEGMKLDESRDVRISPEDAYGEIDPEAIVDIPRQDFPSDVPPEPGAEIEVHDNDGNTLDARIVDVKTDAVTLDFNHPLAGKILDFQVKVVGLRDLTAEERAHGHLHNSDHHHTHEPD